MLLHLHKILFVNISETVYQSHSFFSSIGATMPTPRRDSTASSTSSTSMPAPALLDALGHSMSDKRIEVLRRLVHNGSISQAARDQVFVQGRHGRRWTPHQPGRCDAGGAQRGRRRRRGCYAHRGRPCPVHAADAMEQARAEVLARLQGAGLHQPVLARLAVRTSMRNQWPCTVQSLHTEGSRGPCCCTPTAAMQPLCRPR